MYKVYVLHYPKFNKIYIGISSNLDERTISHNQKGTKGRTIKFRPWSLVYTESFKTKKEALKGEKELKSVKGREFIWNLIKDHK